MRFLLDWDKLTDLCTVGSTWDCPYLSFSFLVLGCLKLWATCMIAVFVFSAKTFCTFFGIVIDDIISWFWELDLSPIVLVYWEALKVANFVMAALFLRSPLAECIGEVTPGMKVLPSENWPDLELRWLFMSFSFSLLSRSTLELSLSLSSLIFLSYPCKSSWLACHSASLHLKACKWLARLIETWSKLYDFFSASNAFFLAILCSCSNRSLNSSLFYSTLALTFRNSCFNSVSTISDLLVCISNCF